MIVVIVAVYIAIGLMFITIRTLLIKAGKMWSVLAAIDDADGYLQRNAKKRALRNNRVLWAIWPPFVFAELMFGFFFGLLIIMTFACWREPSRDKKAETAVDVDW
jgi:hypothetical protein